MRIDSKLKEALIHFGISNSSCLDTRKNATAVTLVPPPEATGYPKIFSATSHVRLKIAFENRKLRDAEVTKDTKASTAHKFSSLAEFHKFKHYETSLLYYNKYDATLAKLTKCSEGGHPRI